ncbi:MAG: PKD domain-containing protein [Sandaracinaceae bacterium]
MRVPSLLASSLFAASLFTALALLACDPQAAPDAASPDSDAGRDAATVEIRAEAGPSRYATVGEVVAFDGSRSTGAESYRWIFGDGEETDASADPTASHAYDSPGRYRAFLEIRGGGRTRTDSLTVSVTRPVVHAPRQSSSVAVAGGEVAVVSPDSNELAVFSIEALALRRRVALPADPRTVTRFGDGWAVACQAAGVLALVTGDRVETIEMPAASRPFGVIAIDGVLYVSLQATGQLARVEDGAVTTFDAIEDARGVSLLPDGRLAVTRWRSPDARAEIAALAPDGSARETWTLGYDPQPGSDTESGGVPSYLEQVLVSPDGALAVVPSLQAAIGEGLFRSPRALTHETTLRAAVSFFDPRGGEEDFERRKLWDDRGFAAAGVLSSRGDFLFLAMRGSRAVERLDLLSGAQAGTLLEVGHAPQGLALSDDDRLLFIDVYLSRELVVYDVADAGALPVEVARLPIPSAEPLSPELLRGKILFNDAADPRIARDSYLACAHCHLEGQSDRRTWDFTDRGEGLRNTIDLLGRAGVGHGPLHWSANFDEVHDFEHDMRGPFRGLGLMDDADYEARSETFGAPKAGLSPDLDALAAYVTSLDAHLPSPHRAPDGSLTEAGARGRVIFEAAGCESCHSGPTLTDSAVVAGAPVLHDVGTLGPGSGGRLGAPLTGLDTPTLHDLWNTAPYLHDGSATLREVLTTRNAGDRHGVTSGLSEAEIDDLIAYLLQLDGRR